MARRSIELTMEEEILILLFWAHGKDISRKISAEKIQAIPGLETAIEAISFLPAAIGWDDEALPDGLTRGLKPNPD